MSALLKQKAKVGVATKERQSYEVADVFKRRAGPGGTFVNVPQQQRGPAEQKEGEWVRKIIKPKIIEEYPQRKMDKQD